MCTQYTWFAKVMKSGSNEAPISGAEMNLIRKCKLGENSAEMINWRVCNTEQCVHVHVTPENICCIFSIAFPDTTPIAVNQWHKIRPHEGINKQVKKTTKKTPEKDITGTWLWMYIRSITIVHWWLCTRICWKSVWVKIPGPEWEIIRDTSNVDFVTPGTVHTTLVTS